MAYPPPLENSNPQNFPVDFGCWNNRNNNESKICYNETIIWVKHK
jgi:hypothetical protein